MRPYTELLTPVQTAIKRRRARRFVWGAMAVTAVVWLVSYRYAPDRPVVYAAIQDHFKYGSIGSDVENGLPWRVLKVLPRVFPEYMPPGNAPDYTAFGFIMESGHETPIGFSMRRRIVDVVGLNCAVCHTAEIRETPDSAPTLILGMPAIAVDLQAFFNFMFACAGDNRFTPDVLLAEMDKDGRLGFVDRFVYRAGIPRLQAGLLQRKVQLDRVLTGHPPFGPGRVDTFNPYKVNQFSHAYVNQIIPEAERYGTVDLPSIWNQRMREGMNLHWDGNNSSVRERNFSAAFGAGATREHVDSRSLSRIADWLRDFPAPPYPFAKTSDAAVLAHGQQLYTHYCAECHSVGARRVGQVIPLAEIGTDEGRLNSYTDKLVTLQHEYGKGYEWGFTHFHKTDGYAAAPLDGIWARAPYLHNGSVPSLWDLLTPAEQRNGGRSWFYTGHGVYDTTNVGFRVDVDGIPGRKAFRFVITDRGNSNKGHSGATYGTALSDADKRALLEYLKTQ
jgi:hypothetical protein